MAAILAVFGATFLASLSGALSPGPLFTYTVRESLRRGFVAGPAVAAGHIAIEAVMVVALGLGVASLIDEYGAVSAVISLAGGVLLLWMGVRMVRGSASAVLETAEVPAGAPGVAPVAGFQTTAASDIRVLAVAGVVISVSNPFWSIWWATVGMRLLSDGRDHGAAGLVSFFSAHALSDLLWLSLVAFLLASGRRLLGLRTYRGLLLACGLGLLGLGAWFLTTGVLYFA